MLGDATWREEVTEIRNKYGSNLMNQQGRCASHKDLLETGQERERYANPLGERERERERERGYQEWASHVVDYTSKENVQHRKHTELSSSSRSALHLH
jgi:hypothetical protein